MWADILFPLPPDWRELISWDANHQRWNACPGQRRQRGHQKGPCLRVESSEGMGRGPVEEETHPECAPRPLIQPCCLAMTNIYLLLKLLGICFFLALTLKQ